MLDKHLRAVDLNLLPVLDALLRHRNATRAGDEVGLSQPAMSRALGRLRDLLGDPLLVRGPGGTRLSPRAEALREPLAALLAQLRDLLVDPPFDPAAQRRVVRLVMSDVQGELLLPPLVRRVAAAAPGVIVEWVPITADVVERMRAGTVDLAFALDTTPLPRGAVSEPLMADSLVVVRRRGHPAGPGWTIADYARYPSVIVALLGDSASEIDAELAAAGVTRSIAAIVPTFRAAAEVAATTDSVTTISRAFATRLAGALPLQLADPPLRGVRLNTVMVWSDHRTRDPLLAWLRQVLHSVVASDLDAG